MTWSPLKRQILVINHRENNVTKLFQKFLKPLKINVCNVLLINEWRILKTIPLKFASDMDAESGPRVSFAAMLAEWHTTMPNAPPPPKFALCVWAAKVFFTADPIKRLAGQPVAHGFSERDKINSQTSTVPQWNGARTRLFPPLSSRKECKRNLWSREWSTPGSRPHRKRCGCAAPQRLPIKCALTSLR